MPEDTAPAGANAQPTELNREAMLKMLQEEPKVEASTEVKPDPGASGKEGEAKPDGQNAQAPQGQQGNEAKPTDERKKKEDERFDRNWKKFSEEKAKLREREAQIEKDLKELEELRLSKVQSTASRQAQEFEQMAAEFEQEGNLEAARIARVKANEAKNEAFTKVNEEKQKRFQSEWKTNYEKLAETHPDLYDDTSDFYKAVEALIKEEPVLRQIPNGINKAVAFVNNSIAASQVDKLKADLAEKDKRIEELTKKTALGGGLPSAIAGDKPFNQMSRSEQRAWLLTQAKQADK